MNCTVCGRESRLDGSGEGCARAWLSASAESRATSMRGPTSHDIVDCERAGRLAALARVEKAEAELADMQERYAALGENATLLDVARNTFYDRAVKAEAELAESSAALDLFHRRDSALLDGMARAQDGEPRAANPYAGHGGSGDDCDDCELYHDWDIGWLAARGIESEAASLRVDGMPPVRIEVDPSMPPDEWKVRP